MLIARLGKLMRLTEEIEHTTRVTPLVIVPGDQFDEMLIESDSRLGIKDAGMTIPIKIRRDDFILGIGHDACRLVRHNLL